MNAKLPISIRGAKQFNLKNIDIDLPRNSLIVLCGPSGSGKSTLAVDTLFAESRRRFLDCLSSKIRQSMTQPDKPDADSITGLPPALCLEQSPGLYGPRSLLGNITEIIDYLRVAFAAIGIPHDPDTGRELIRMTSDSIAEALLANPAGTRLTLLSPVHSGFLSGEESDVKDTLRDFLRQGFLRVMWDGEIRDIDDILTGALNSAPEHLSIVIDRIILRGEESASRLADSMQTAFRINPDEISAVLQPQDAPARHESFYTRYRNPDTGFVLPQLTPKHFSFNSPQGFCPACQGMGTVNANSSGKKAHHTIKCPECRGSRLNPIARAVTLLTGSSEVSLPELLDMPLEDFADCMAHLEIPGFMEPAIRQVKNEIEKRTGFLNSLGLGYLSLSRPASTLSGGELQRARLASQLGGGLSGVLYILDEPTIGLHPEDTDRLIKALKRLRDMGNTILVIEHDEQLLREADYMVDMGPGSGPLGGSVLFQGTSLEIMDTPQSITGPWLSGSRQMPSFSSAPLRESPSGLVLKGAHAHNLKNVDLILRGGTLTCLSGPSGSGKSTLVMDCLIPALKDADPKGAGPVWDSLEGASSFSRFALIDQSPIGQSPRSTPATATGFLNILRPLFAHLPLSRQRGYTASRFSTNVRGGRCERCLGTGFIEVDMHFLSNVIVPCDACQGRRYNRETLEVTWRGKSIAQLLALSVDEALEIFAPIPRAAAILKSLQRIGLGYMTLDRPSSTLSGGEAQRVKIATELAKIPDNPGGLPPSLFILDEPTTGLHFQEVAMLIQALGELRNAGHTILCIEHNLDMLAAADLMIDMGPGAGKNGGIIVDQGTPIEIATRNISPTAPWLRSRLSRTTFPYSSVPS
ncbi:excinuclease ABC subunit UvrA [Akkermansia sp. N21116]|uniref:excinuclease ABC subunit UvrA n=1 Tax=Akkermansia sp. N21116 TaxID=3040764 RepID=UPI00244EE83C|nr:excinuclease ABC subunit UvrA [Akkermansia sp. N21116]WPX39332.1 excinuclease ABC subunit UvrA [Akkermansia sp. N21116]